MRVTKATKPKAVKARREYRCAYDVTRGGLRGRGALVVYASSVREAEALVRRVSAVLMPGGKSKCQVDTK